MKFSLVAVQETNGPLVDGSWIQNHIGTLESASRLAREYERDSSWTNVAVVAEIPSTTPGLSYWQGRERLDSDANGLYQHRYEGRLASRVDMKNSAAGPVADVVLQNGRPGVNEYSTALRGLRVTEEMASQLQGFKPGDRIRIDATSLERQTQFSLEPPRDIQGTSVQAIRSSEISREDQRGSSKDRESERDLGR